MPKGIKWNEILQNQGNKEELIKLIAQHMMSEEARGTIKQPFIVTEGNNTYRVERNGCELFYRCNHKVADTRLVLHASLEAADVVIVSKNTDVLILLIWAYSKLSVCKTWLFKEDHDKYADIGVICQFLGNDLCQALPAIHAISGCDTTSYFYKTGKVKIIKKLLSSPSNCQILESFGQDQSLESEKIDNVKEFIRTVVYSGKVGESYVETRIQLYKEMKSKSSSSIPPDPDSVKQAIRRANYQVFHWVRCCEVNIETVSFENHGWKWDKEKQVVVPIWFKGKQLPPSLSTSRKKTAKNLNYDE
ncbi:uncharacterized protein LOC135682604 [Rhopilema esculentum]|uniref:uncharacterized protein LOC135682604 n=1 Tax=Rhopilema esculentum TaxID=499914 RepID=UPI0031CE97B9